jgi:non-ribosomal peptide synthetase component F
VDDEGRGFRLTAQVQTGIGAMRVCEFMSTALGSLVEALERGPRTPVRGLEVLPERERRQVLYEWNQTQAEFPGEECIHELFEEQVRKSPEAVAAVYEEASLTYGELNRRANRLGHYLRGMGVGPDVRVGICVERSLEMVVALVGVLKAGGAYVPLDAGYPAERLRYMLEDSAPVALLTQKHLKSLFGWVGEGVSVVEVGGEEEQWKEQPENDLERERVGLTSRHLAYVIYTSGSTGSPKGVMVEHRGLCNMLIAQIRSFDVQSESRVLQFASFSFDACA